MIKQRSPSAVMLTADSKIDRRILLQAESLKAAGWDVVIVAPTALAEHSVEGYDVCVVRAARQASPKRSLLSWASSVRLRLRFDDRLTRLMRTLAWRFVVDPETFFRSLLLETVLQYQPSVFVAHDLPMLSVARHAAEACGAKLIYDSHELYPEQDFTNWETKLWRNIEARHIGSCDAVITVNQSIAAELKRRYGLKKVDVILNAERSVPVPVRSGLLRSRLNLSNETRLILFQGGLSPARNLECLLQAIPMLKISDAHLVFLGDGPFCTKLKQKARRLNLDRRVHFLPAVAQHELLEWTASADLGVIPYAASCLNNYFCTPNKMFEFISAGVPVVASDLPELNRFVRGYEIGLTGDTSSPSGFAAMIDEIFSSPGLMDRLRDQIKIAQGILNWENESRSLLSIYARVQ